MSLECRDGEWSVMGKGSSRARIAYATLENGKLRYVLPVEKNEKTSGVQA